MANIWIPQPFEKMSLIQWKVNLKGLGKNDFRQKTIYTDNVTFFTSTQWIMFTWETWSAHFLPSTGVRFVLQRVYCGRLKCAGTQAPASAGQLKFTAMRQVRPELPSSNIVIVFWSSSGNTLHYPSCLCPGWRARAGDDRVWGERTGRAELMRARGMRNLRAHSWLTRRAARSAHSCWQDTAYSQL